MAVAECLSEKIIDGCLADVVEFSDRHSVYRDAMPKYFGHLIETQCLFG